MSAKWPTQKPSRIGKLTFLTFTFENAGDFLPLHSHPEGEAHVTFVNAGRLRIHGPGWERIVEPGAQLKFDPGQEHAYEALLPGSKITNIVY